MDTKKSVQQQFGAVAAHYASSSVHASGQDLTAMLNAAKLHDDKRVLDIGCGTGHTALAFADHVAEVRGVDLTPEMLDQARRLAAERNITNVFFEQSDVAHLPFAAASFDIVTSRYSAHHYADPVGALREVTRVLKQDGMFLLTDVMAPKEPAADIFLNAIELLRDPSHVRDYAVIQWQEMFAEVGLMSEILGVWLLHLDFDAWVTRMQTPEAAIAQIRTLIDGTSDEVRAALSLNHETYSFRVPTALMRGRFL
ncbi:MAG: class I SAM-dependent methyltransferase [Chloroflexota bacterium]